MILKNDENCILLDVRSPQEYKEGHLEGSINIPLYNLANDIDVTVKNKNFPIIVYCQTGNRSKNAVKILSKKGYKELYNIAGGIDNM